MKKERALIGKRKERKENRDGLNRRQEPLGLSHGDRNLGAEAESMNPNWVEVSLN